MKNEKLLKGPRGSLIIGIAWIVATDEGSKTFNRLKDAKEYSVGKTGTIKREDPETCKTTLHSTF